MGVERETVAVELGGKSYQWVEPVRRDARGMLRDIYAIQEKNPAADIDPSQGLSMVDDILDFFFKWNEDMNDDQQALNNVDEQSIAQAFSAVAQFVMRPFAATTMATPKPKIQTRKRASTKR